jgi:mRNA interferase YafQ
MYELSRSTQFKKDYKLIVKRNYDLHKLEDLLKLLISGNPLPKEYKNHPLSGNFKNHFDCHITPDWLVVYKKNEKEKLITLIRTGTHSDIFK